jgi:hypothetical protein
VDKRTRLLLVFILAVAAFAAYRLATSATEPTAFTRPEAAVIEHAEPPVAQKPC